MCCSWIVTACAGCWLHHPRLARPLPARRERSNHCAGVIQPMPAPPGSIRIDDAADAGHIERGLHDLGARLEGLLDARVDIIDGDVRHPALGNAVVVGATDIEDAADRFVAHLGDPVSAVGAASAWRHSSSPWCRHRISSRPRRRASSVRSSRNVPCVPRICLLPFWWPGLGCISCDAQAKEFFHLVERAVPAALVAVAGIIVEELFMRECQQGAVTVRFQQHRHPRFTLWRGFPGPGENQLLAGDDFAVDAADVMLLAVGDASPSGSGRRRARRFRRAAP